MTAIRELVDAQRAYFDGGATLPAEFRIKALDKLGAYIEKNEKTFFDAMYADLNKAPQEAYMTEIGLALHELGYIKDHLKKWLRPERRLSPLSQFPAESYTTPVPYGVSLIISPWNYPFMLAVDPLVGSIAGGNCTLMKPASETPATAAAVADMVKALFPPEYVHVILGSHKDHPDLLAQNYDCMFFTGSVPVGKEVMKAAADCLANVTLELGGKSPCIVCGDADLELAARRIVFGKFENAGQTCVAPDYVLAHKSVAAELIKLLEKEIISAFGEEPLQNKDYPKMVDERHFKRALGLLAGSKVSFGGQSDINTLKIAPTILTEVTESSACMSEEIFGPLLPVLEWENTEEALAVIKKHEHPLALYIFSDDKKGGERLMDTVSSGCGCINDCIVQVSSPYIPFGGVKESGVGHYHGKYSFDAFTHQKGVMYRGKADLPLRYHPYSQKKLDEIKKLLH